MLVYIKSTITAHRQVKLEPIGIESICLDVKGSENTWFIICACYRSPGKCKSTEFLTACSTAAEQMYIKRKEIIFIGDFNMNMLKGNKNQQGPDPDLTGFRDLFCLTNVIVEPTRVTKSTASLIDVILVSHPERISTYGNLDLGISDYDMVYMVRKQKLPKPKAKTIEFRSTKNLDKNAFVCDLNEIPWDSAYVFDNIDDTWQHLVNLYNQVLNKHAPMIQMKLRNKQLPWINTHILKQIRVRNRLYKKFRRVTSDINWNKYREQRNLVTKLKRRGIKEFCLKASTSNQNHGDFRKKLKPLLPNSKSNSDNQIHLIEDGKLTTNPASMFNEYFATPVINESVLNLDEDHFLDHASITIIKNLKVDLNFSFEEINCEYVTRLLSTIDEKKSSGTDEIPSYFLKISTPAIAAPLTTLFNHCIAN